MTRRSTSRTSAAVEASARSSPSWATWLGLALVAFASYYPAWYGELLWDDSAHVTHESMRSWDGLWRIWTDPGATQQYYPVLHSTFWFLHKLWGDATTGYHLTTIGLHALGAGLLTVVLRGLQVPGAVLAGYIFALHPVQVESVAWISELKNTLSTVGYLLAALLYLRFETSQRVAPYVSGLAVFVLAVLTKSVTASFPAALLVIAWWRRGRLEWHRDVVPLLPWFVIGIAVGVITIWMERVHVGAFGPAFDLSLLERGLVAGRALVFYAWTWVWPHPLSFVYPRWAVDETVGWQYVYPLMAFAAVAACWWFRRTSRGPVTAVLLYAGALFPALGFFNVYPFIFSWVADHFMYLAALPLSAATASLLTTKVRDLRVRNAASMALCVVLGSLTWRQAQHYVNAETLYLSTLERNPAAWLAHLNLGSLRLQQGRIDEAIQYSLQALALEPNLPEALNNLGAARRAQREFVMAESHLRRSLTLAPDDERTRYNLALTLIDLKRPDEALPHVEAYLAVNAGDGGAHAQRADILQSLGRLDEAIAAYRESLRLEPANVQARTNFGSALGRLGRHEEALSELTEVLRLDPAYLPAARNTGYALLNLGRVSEAIARFEDIVRRNPSETAHADLDNARAFAKSRGGR